MKEISLKDITVVRNGQSIAKLFDGRTIILSGCIAERTDTSVKVTILIKDEDGNIPFVFYSNKTFGLRVGASRQLSKSEIANMQFRASKNPTTNCVGFLT